MGSKRKAVRKKKGRKKNNFLVLPLVLLLLFSVFYFFWLHYKRPVSTVSKIEVIKHIPEGFRSFGIDVSHHQGEIDWDLLFKQERYDTIIHFVYCKATEGSNFLDSRWYENREKLQQLQIPNGAYHFLSPKSEAKEQAIHFLSHWKKHELDLPPVLDVEIAFETDKALVSTMKKWLLYVEEKCGLRPIIYTSLHFYETKFKEDFKDYKFWIASYSRRANIFEDGRVIHWQYCENGTLPGIPEEVDFNVSKLTLY